jgi:uncharacterized RDD family membrane protein YckC
MTCSTCLSPLPDDAAFCNWCGVRTARCLPRPRYAGFWRRVLALLIDLILLAPAFETAKEVWLGQVFTADERNAVAVYAPESTDASPDDAEMSLLWAIGEILGMCWIVAAPYVIACESSELEGTLGKRLLGLRVTDFDGRRISTARATARYFARWLSFVMWGGGFLVAAFTRRKQTVHDMVTRTVIVVRGESARQQVPPSAACARCAAHLPDAASCCAFCGALAGFGGKRFGGLRRRAAAFVLDLFFLLPPMVVLRGAFGLPFTPRDMRDVQAYCNPHVPLPQRLATGNRLVARMAGLWLVIILTSGVYYAVMESSTLQGSFGKRIAGLKVTDVEGRRIGFARASKRFFYRIFSVVCWLTGYLMAAFTERKQGLHDILTGTLVLKTVDPASDEGSVHVLR